MMNDDDLDVTNNDLDTITNGNDNNTCLAARARNAALNI